MKVKVKLFDVFTAWEPLFKSLKAEQVTRLAELLNNTEADDITFTAIDFEGNTKEYVLGSIEGNSKFLLGYLNPGFRLMPYHFIMIDPNITDEEAQKMMEERGHPANPRFWAEAGVDPFFEGPDEGTPHPSVPQNTESEEDASFEFTFKGKSYMSDPDNQLVYCLSDEKVYHWSLLRNTFFASQNPDLVQLMDLYQVTKLINEIPAVKEAEVYKGQLWDDNVLPLVKGVLPSPGSAVKLESDTIGIVTSDSVYFVNNKGIMKSLQISNTDVDSISLSPEGVGSVILLDFMNKYFNIDVNALENFIV
jgi:hypothetical protein